jgi:hypothetical protein
MKNFMKIEKAIVKQESINIESANTAIKQQLQVVYVISRQEMNMRRFVSESCAYLIGII